MDFLIKCVNILSAIRLSILHIYRENIQVQTMNISLLVLQHWYWWAGDFSCELFTTFPDEWWSPGSRRMKLRSLHQWEGSIWALDQWGGLDLTRMGKCYVTRPIGDSGGVETQWTRASLKCDSEIIALYFVHMFLVKIKQMFNILVSAH